jgi:hypothetical protein
VKFAGIGGYFHIVVAGFCLCSAALSHSYYAEKSENNLEEIAVAFGDKAFADGDEDVMESATVGNEKTQFNA